MHKNISRIIIANFYEKNKKYTHHEKRIKNVLIGALSSS